MTLAGALVVAALFGDDGVGRHERLRTELHRVQAMNETLRAQNRRLAIERRALRHDPDYIDALIRDHLGYVRSDEMIPRIEGATTYPPALRDRHSRRPNALVVARGSRLYPSRGHMPNPRMV